MIEVILQHIVYKIFYYHHMNLRIECHYIRLNLFINSIQIHSIIEIIGLNFNQSFFYFYQVNYIFYSIKLNLNFDIYL